MTMTSITHEFDVHEASLAYNIHKTASYAMLVVLYKLNHGGRQFF